MSGDGEATGDGSIKARSAISCMDLYDHFGTYTPGKFWIGSAQVVCGFDRSGQPTQFGDGSSEALSAQSCQSVLDHYGDGPFKKGKAKLYVDGVQVHRSISFGPRACILDVRLPTGT